MQVLQILFHPPPKLGVATLALGSGPRQGLAKVQHNNEV